MIIDIIDIGMGNVSSLVNALNSINYQSKIIRKPDDLSSNTIILPGVGSAKQFMENLKKNDLDKSIVKKVKQGCTLIGICLGSQILMQHSEEDGGVECLGLIKGNVLKINSDHGHNGWEKIEIPKKLFENSSIILKRNISGRVYFNHEYGINAADTEAKCLYINTQGLNRFSSMVLKSNIIGFQFHPEKSQQTGLEILKMVLK